MVVILIFITNEKEKQFRYDFTKIPNFYFKLSN